MSRNRNTRKYQAEVNTPAKNYRRYLIIALVVITVITYIKSLNNQFITTWDDSEYVVDNQSVRALSSSDFKTTFTKIFKNYELGNYHPLTMLNYALEYKYFKLNPKAYHAMNLILHVLNTLFVFLFISLLSRKFWAAFITALLFAIHPMHVESVAWISERKDLLYSFFYLLALVVYVMYIRKEKRNPILYGITLFLFILSLFSKAMAVTLPVTFFIIDYFMSRKFTLKSVLEKTPFFVLSLIFGYIAIEAQNSVSAISNVSNSQIFDRILFAGYGFFMYLYKLILPVNLSCFYGYPVKESGMYPIIFYVVPFFLLFLIIVLFKAKNYRKEITFGFGFFLITIALVIQLIPVGNAIMADRYSYLPYIGLFFIIGSWINRLLENRLDRIRKIKYAVLSVFSLFVVLCCYISYNRCEVWHDNISLWTDAIKKNNMVPTSLSNRGVGYIEAGQYEKGIVDLTAALRIQYDFPDVIYNRGLAYCYLGKYMEGIADFTAAIKINPESSKAYNNRGNAYFVLGRFKEAINDYSLSINHDPTNKESYYNRGQAYKKLGEFAKALQDSEMAGKLGVSN